MKSIRFLIFILIGISVPGCVMLFPHKEFKKADQRALFTTHYAADPDGTLNTGLYLLYDESCSKFLKGGGFILFEDGRVESAFLSLDFLCLKDATSENMEKLIDAHFLTFGSEGIYFVKGEKLLTDIYYNPMYKIWELSKEEYIIIDENTVETLPTENEINRICKVRKLYRRIAMFSSLSFPSKQSIKNKKWMWESGSEWKIYKKSEEIRNK